VELVPTRRLLKSAFALLLVACSIQAATNETASPPRAAVFYEGLPGNDQAFASEIAAQVRAAGYATEYIYVPILTNRASLTATRYDLLVLPNARILPLSAAPAIVNYLHEGGDLLALGLPAWQSPAFQLNGKWLSRQDYDDTIAAQRPNHIVQDFSRAELAQWHRSTGDSTGKAQYEVADTDHGRALHATIPHLGGWETMTSPALSQPFAMSNTLTCFRAKGAPHTRQLSVEWREEDGSRWIGTVDLTPQWQDCALTPDRFKAWPADSVSKHRIFNPAQAVTCTVGLALSHTALEGDEHEYWFAALGTAPNPFGADTPPEEADIPVLESISPSYQCYPITTQVIVRPDHQKAPLESWDTPPPGGGWKDVKGCKLDALSCLGLQPRSRGVGFNQRRPYQWEPLLGAYDSHTEDYRGAVAALVVNVEPPFRGSVWAAFTPTDAAFYRQPVTTNALHQVLTRMKRGIFLAEGGTEFFTLFPGQQFTSGARAVNFGREALTNLSINVMIDENKGNLPKVVLLTNFTLLPGEMKSVAQSGLMKDFAENPVYTSLTQENVFIDAFDQTLSVWRPKLKPQFIQARDGGFWLNGKPWKAHGVNYMPSSGIGLANYQYFEHWLGRGAYDPEVIQRDLLRIKAMNLNAVSIFIDHQSLDSQHLLDFLRRCEALGLHVNLSLRPGTPMSFQWEKMKDIIEHYRLAENDTVFAYDLAWEPSHGGYAEQQRDYAGLWHQWVLKHYQTIAAATNAWGCPAPRLIPTPHTTISPLSEHLTAISIDVPPMSQLITDGPWRKLVADYRRFLDELLQERYSTARRLIHSVDPNHAVSFRMSCAGDPTYNWDAALPYDFRGLADAVDIWAPEAYGRIGDWPRVRAGDFTAAYARLCDPNKPIMWAEMGYSVWDINRMTPDPEKLAWEARYFTDFYRMLIESGADGVFFWWYPGGFRLGENSDFGIIAPDGTDRPITQVIRTEGQRFLKALKPAAPNEWITVNRDRDARGLYGIYEAVQESFWKAMNLNHRPALKDEQGPGTPKQ
jgi:hypothetical protein